MRTLVEDAKSGQAEPDQPAEYVQFVHDALADGWVPATGEDAIQWPLFATLIHTQSPLNMDVSAIGPPSGHFIRVVRPGYGLTAVIKPPYDWGTLTAKAERVE